MVLDLKPIKDKWDPALEDYQKAHQDLVIHQQRMQALHREAETFLAHHLVGKPFWNGTLHKVHKIKLLGDFTFAKPAPLENMSVQVWLRETNGNLPADLSVNLGRLLNSIKLGTAVNNALTVEREQIDKG